MGGWSLGNLMRNKGSMYTKVGGFIVECTAYMRSLMQSFESLNALVECCAVSYDEHEQDI